MTTIMTMKAAAATTTTTTSRKRLVFNLLCLFSSFNFQAGVFMGFSITSAVFGGIIIICYGISIATYGYDYDNYNYSRYGNRYYDVEMALSAIILILGIVEFATGIWAAVCLCLMKPCTCCCSTPPQQV